MCSSVRYSALSQKDSDEESEVCEEAVQKPSGIEFGMPEGSFDSVFTYANYNDLDRMGYVAPKRFGNYLGNRYSHYTYSANFDREEDPILPPTFVELIIYLVSLLFVVLTMPLSLLFALKFVSPTEQMVVLRLGRAQKTRGPGMSFVMPCIDTTHKVPTCVTAFNVPPLQVITTDRGLIELGATVFLKVRDPVAAVCGVQDRNHSIRTLANTMMYRHISRTRVCQICNAQDRRILTATFKDELGNFTSQFGVEVTEIEMSDVKVLKEAENMGMSALSSVVRSDAGKQLWQVISPAVEEFSRQCAEEKKEGKQAANAEAPTADKNLENADIDHIIDVANLVIDEHLTNTIGKLYQEGLEKELLQIPMSFSKLAKKFLHRLSKKHYLQ